MAGWSTVASGTPLSLRRISRHRSSVVELSIRNRTRPAHASAGRCVFNELGDASDGPRRPATPPLAPPLAPRASPRTEPRPALRGTSPDRVAEPQRRVQASPVAQTTTPMLGRPPPSLRIRGLDYLAATCGPCLPPKPHA